MFLFTSLERSHRALQTLKAEDNTLYDCLRSEKDAHELLLKKTVYFNGISQRNAFIIRIATTVRQIHICYI